MYRPLCIFFTSTYRRQAMLLLFMFCFIFCAGNQTQAQAGGGYVYVDSALLDNPVDENAGTRQEGDVVTDTTLYTHEVVIAADTINAWKNDPRFAYVKNLDSLLAERKKQLAEAGRGSSGDSYQQAPDDRTASTMQNVLSSNILGVVFWILAGCFILFILYKLFLNQGVFRRNRTAAQVNEMQEEELVPADPSDYDVLIQQSFKLQDYRMAVRYLFLKTLWKLSDKGLLERSVDKTNFQYVQEIAPRWKKEFASIVLKYEYIWYGHLTITREQFEQVEKNYSAFNNKIQ